MSRIAEFYGFKVHMDDSFSGELHIVIDYEEDGYKDIYYLKAGAFDRHVFPDYLVEVVKEWIADNIELLMEMWTEKRIITVPEWE